MKRAAWVLGGIAAALILLSSAGPAMAYFSTYSRAKGGYTLPNSSTVRLLEDVRDWTKTVSVVNDEGSGPVFIRVRAYAGSNYTLVYAGDENWRDGGDGWWYYIPILEAQTRRANGTLAGGTATGLTVTVAGIPANAEPGDSLNVIVVYESTPVQYDSTGAAYADWAMRMDARSVEE